MSSGNRIYRKTDKGGEAIVARLHGLVGRPRSLLILVDGKRGSDELMQMAAGFGDVAQMLEVLEHDGFIEVVGQNPAPTAATASAPATTDTHGATGAHGAHGSAASLAQARVVACRRLIELLGPTAEPLCLKIESTHTRPDFIGAVQRAYAVVQEIRGPAQADRFGEAVEAQMPAE